MSDTGRRIEYDGISVDFGPTRALADIGFAVAPGEIVGLLGHNGAGKSTLFNVTAGVIAPSAGSFRVDGATVGAGLTPSAAARLGITVVHQEPALAPNLTVLENLVLGHRPLPRAERRRRAEAALAAVGADLHLDVPVEVLGLGERQLVDLARGMLAGEMKVLLLDEPTAALGKEETDALHRLIRRFASEGTAVMYVSHRLPDILEVCSRIVVLSGGRVTVDGPSADFTPAALAEALVPELRSLEFSQTSLGPEVLRIASPSGEIAARAGEVVGVFGMAGGEQFDLAARIGGAGGAAAYRLAGEEVRVSAPSQAIRRSVFFVPPDRDRDGLVGAETALDNVMLPWYRRVGARGWWVTARTGAEAYAEAHRGLDIRGPGPQAEVSQFSGGNRQKHLLARWLYPVPPTLLVLSQPTQGVDVGARLDIVEAVRTAAANGAAVVVASCESDEIASMCDRAYAVLGDRQVEVPRTTEFNEDLLTALLGLAEPTESLTP